MLCSYLCLVFLETLEEEGGRGRWAQTCSVTKQNCCAVCVASSLRTCVLKLVCANVQTYDGLGLDRPLFWMEPKKMNLSQFPALFPNLFKVGSFFTEQQTRSIRSLR